MRPHWIALITLLLAASADAQEAPPLYVEGYTDQLSYRPGETVALHVSTPAKTFAVEVAREGPTREVVWSKTGLPGAEHPVPPDASSRGCRWPVATTIPVA